MSRPLRGILTALVTPFDEKGEIDWASWERLIRDQIAAGVDAVVPCGTTGESPTLRRQEKCALIESAIRICKDSSVAVLAGTGSNSTPDTVEFSSWASQAGVDGVLVVTPYYNKPSQAGLYDHFIQVAQAVNCPVILYNVPGRTGVGISPETVAKLALNPKIRAIKEASGNVAFSSDILDACRSAGTSIEILSGDDATYLPALAVGATGVISVASNLFPRAMVEMKNAWNAKQPDRAMELHQQYYPLFRDLFIESNPTPIKTALSWVGMGLPQVRPPLNPLSESSLKQLQASLVACGFSRQGGTR